MTLPPDLIDRHEKIRGMHLNRGVTSEAGSKPCFEFAYGRLWFVRGS